MGVKQVMFLGLILAAGTMISLTFGGAWLSGTDLSVANSFTVFKQVNILGLWSANLPNIDFFISGAKALMQMDFAFFEGPGGSLMQWFMFFIFGIGFFWGLYTTVIGIFSGIFKR